MASSSANFVISMTNSFNDLKREIIGEISAKFQSKDSWTKEELRELLNNELVLIKANKKVKKESKPRFSGYHLFMKEKRIEVKKEQPNLRPQQMTGIVSQAWGTLSKEEQQAYNVRAAQNKRAFHSSSLDSEKEDNKYDTDASAVDDEKQASEKEKKPAAEKKVKRPASEKKEKKPAAEKKEKKPAEKKEKPEKKVKKAASPSPPPPHSDDEDEDHCDLTVDDADSDIDL